SSIGAAPKPKLPPPEASETTILSPKYSSPPATRALILLAIDPNTTSAQIPMVMPEIVSTVRSFRRVRVRRSFIVRPWVYVVCLLPERQGTGGAEARSSAAKGIRCAPRGGVDHHEPRSEAA